MGGHDRHHEPCMTVRGLSAETVGRAQQPSAQNPVLAACISLCVFALRGCAHAKLRTLLLRFVDG